MTKQEANELKRVERRCRAILERRLERGESIDPWNYGVDVYNGRVGTTIDSCSVCLLGSVVLDQYKVGCKVGKFDDEHTLSAKTLRISLDRAHDLESGFMTNPGATEVVRRLNPWERLGHQLRLDYYEVTDPYGVCDSAGEAGVV